MVMVEFLRGETAGRRGLRRRCGLHVRGTPWGVATAAAAVV